MPCSPLRTLLPLARAGRYRENTICIFSLVASMLGEFRYDVLTLCGPETDCNFGQLYFKHLPGSIALLSFPLILITA